ncbi:Protein of unknown function [Pyronema omphalodes CBS 100304]|uniref:Uncharacterized protein n=1 Tax=Pyronema omphalodes (strain CBS 100304) TaxID=1076935 RepID=U4LRF5_PYROM|nr:Protein of unknown function [Pyronema omphalodes CBS 100304]
MYSMYHRWCKICLVTRMHSRGLAFGTIIAPA